MKIEGSFMHCRMSMIGVWMETASETPYVGSS